MRNEIAIKKLHKVILPQPLSDGEPSIQKQTKALTLQANLINLGFIMDKELSDALANLHDDDLIKVSSELVTVLRKLKGANVSYNPMYPNFPRQVMEASDLELWVNAILHYWTRGEFLPDYVKLPRGYAPENVKLIEIGLLKSEDEFASIFTKILGSNESISGEDKNIVKWFLDNYGNLKFPETIPFKENMSLVGAYMLENGYDVSHLVKNSTDVLRIATAASNGDVSLADNTKFKSFKRSQRRNLVKALEAVISEEDIARHAGKWVRLAHSLHVGDYSKKVFNIIGKVRNNEKIMTFNSKVEEFLKKSHVVKATMLLMERPGDFARRLDHVLRLAKDVKNQMRITEAFVSVSDKVSTNVLLQIMGHFKNRSEDLEKRVVLPKGSVQRAQLINGLDALDCKVTTSIYNGCYNTLVERFKENSKNYPELGKVFLDPSLKDCPIPTQQRSANTALQSVARGTKMSISDDKTTLRFFIYWVGRDIDLSVTLYDANFNDRGHVSYTRLRNIDSGIFHSGDIVDAPNGASEFIDLDIEKALNNGTRYVAMNVYVFNGPSFVEHETCFVGWMTRSRPNSNEIYEPSTVENKIDMTSESKISVPVVFDLKERKAIWVDLSAIPNRYVDSYFGGNNVENNKASVKDIVEAMISNKNKVSLYTLFKMHADASAESIVDNPEDADTIFGWDGNITPKDMNEIHSRFTL